MNLSFYFPKLLKTLVYAIIVLTVVISVIWFFTTTVSSPATTSTGKSADQMIEYSDFISFIKYHFNYNTSITQEEFNSYKLGCRDTSSIDTIIAKSSSAYTYCRTKDISAINIGFSWKSHTLTKKVFEQGLITKLSPLFMTKTNSTGQYSCTTDKTYVDATGMKGVLTDCKVTEGPDIYYLSLFYFYPPTKPNLDQIIDVEGTDVTVVHSAIRDLVKKVHA